MYFLYHYSTGIEGMLQSHGYPRTPLRSYGDPEMADPLRLSPQERQKGKYS
jgi:hypothetical protein